MLRKGLEDYIKQLEINSKKNNGDISDVINTHITMLKNLLSPLKIGDEVTLNEKNGEKSGETKTITDIIDFNYKNDGYKLDNEYGLYLIEDFKN